MEPLLLVVLLGGLLLAFILRRWHHPSELVTSPPPRPATDVINMAHIKVSGVGGLGMVALAVIMAFAIPRIGQTVAAGLVLGVALAVFLIVRRRQRDHTSADGGPVPDGGMLDLRDRRPARYQGQDSSASRMRAAGVLSAKC